MIRLVLGFKTHLILAIAAAPSQHSLVKMIAVGPSNLRTALVYGS